MTSLKRIEGIGDVYEAKLKAAGVTSQEALLKVGASTKGRKELAAKSGIDEDLVLRWVNHVDLGRIKGVGEEYAELLEAAGVDTVVELANRNAENLFQKMAEFNESKKKVRRLPTAAQVSAWIAQAKALPRVVTY
jgi:predicted flap endonuclease-1-like 5' DNA nuclease